MSRTTYSSPAPKPAADPRSPQVLDALKKVRGLVEERDYSKAMEVIARAKTDSPWLTNAAGVCQLRSGNPKAAVDAFRGLVLASGGLVLRPDVPACFKTNYATALLLSGNPDGAVGVLREMGGAGGPMAEKLERAVANWKLGLSIWQKLNWRLGGHPSKPIELGFPPGELE